MKLSLKQEIVRGAQVLGFQKVGIAAAQPIPQEQARLEQWLRAGYQGQMQWLQRRAAERGDIRRYFPAAKSIVCVAMNYFTGHSRDKLGGGFNFSNYAWGDDYHILIRERLAQLLDFIQGQVAGVQGLICVDTSPVLEKVWARRAGLGWLGKNTNLISRDYGSWLFLGELLLDIELEYDEPYNGDFCGSCTACVDACPTGALTEYVLDARKCISYLTIEHRGELPVDSAGLLNGWIYGCDICQEVCPWNKRFATVSAEPAFRVRERIRTLTITEWNDLDEAGFRELFRNSAVKRTKLAGLQRNLAVVERSPAHSG
ncbi:MAG: tRNA epoxyqueuosine(34) reductase QueG [Candidatus Neomarinimicrobiota bacterium]